MDIKTIVIAGLIGTLGGGLVSTVSNHFTEGKISKQLRERPPIAVIDFVKIIADKQSEEGVTAEQVEALVDGIHKTTLMLHESGYLILDASQIVAAPELLYLNEEEILK